MMNITFIVFILYYEMTLRLADLRWAGFLPLHFMRSTKLSATTKVSAEHETPPIANVLLPAAVSRYLTYSV